jgi:hypothetical protein
MRWRRRHLLVPAVAAVWCACSTYGRDDVTTIVVHDDGSAEGGEDASVDADAGADVADVADVGDAPSVDAGPRLVFVTANMYTPPGMALEAGGVCPATAAFAHLAGTFSPWLSYTNAGTSPAKTLADDGPWLTRAGDLVAKNRSTLLSGVLSHAIDRDENGNLVTGKVWTGTATNGTPSGNDCQSWTSASVSALGSFGDPSQTDATWTNSGVENCNVAAHVYCFQQP